MGLPDELKEAFAEAVATYGDRLSGLGPKFEKTVAETNSLIEAAIAQVPGVVSAKVVNVLHDEVTIDVGVVPFITPATFLKVDFTITPFSCVCVVAPNLPDAECVLCKGTGIAPRIIRDLLIASGAELDRFTEGLGIPGRAGESDAELRDRIIAHIRSRERRAGPYVPVRELDHLTFAAIMRQRRKDRGR